jgi:hypothetical protein
MRFFKSGRLGRCRCAVDSFSLISISDGLECSKCGGRGEGVQILEIFIEIFLLVFLVDSK